MKRDLSRRQLLGRAAAGGAAIGVAGLAAGAASPPPPAAAPARQPGQRSVRGLKHPPLEKVRIGMIGLGGRGNALLGNLLDIDKVEVRALCDIVPVKVRAAAERVMRKGKAGAADGPALYSAGETDFENLCRRDDLDLVYVATPMAWHARMALAAMNAGKHVAVEVPAAITLEECWQLVDAAERTRRHCMMLENCCYGEVEMLVLNMVRAGVFGQVTHAEAAYIHPMAEWTLRQDASAVWRRELHMRYDGNLYPTHGLGPVAQYLGIHGGDRFDLVVSMSSAERVMSELRDALPADDPRRAERYACGDMNSSLIRTALGRTILLQYSTATPRPYTRLNLVSGTAGTFADYPPRIFLKGQKDWEADLAPWHAKHGHALWKRLKAQAQASGGHGGMDFVMNHRLVECLLAGTELDMSVYAAAAWSSLMPLSIASVAQGSMPVAVPDFTRGEWR